MAWRLAFGDSPRERVVRDYLDYADTGRPEAQYAMSAVDGMNDNGYPPEGQWGLICELIRSAPTDNALAFVAESPFAELLWRHHDAFLGRVLAEAESDARFARALTLVTTTLLPATAGEAAALARVREMMAAEPKLPGWKRPW